MDPIKELLNLLKNDDKQLFRQFLLRKNKRVDVKNLQLLNFLETDDIDGLKKIYDSPKNDDAYHALRKRLQDNLLLFYLRERLRAIIPKPMMRCAWLY